MCCVFSEHFAGIFLLLCLILYDLSRSGIGAYSPSSNTSDEIKKIFSSSHSTETALNGTLKSGNFGEGGLINLTHSTSTTSITNATDNYVTPKNFGHDKSPLRKTSSVSTTTTRNTSSEVSTSKTLLPVELTDNGSNLFLGVPEVIHVNGTSSIKPRKGVQLNKIVPRKGVDTEDELTPGLLESDVCYKMADHECYDLARIQLSRCSPCKEGNTLGRVIKKEAVTNCTNCKQINVHSYNEDVCCSSVDKYSESTINTSDKYKTGQKKQENTTKHHEQPNVTKKMVAETKDGSKGNSKQKPSMTKVPYDVEVVTELLSKNQKKVFVPIVVSIFLLPLIGILVFFLWRRTKEYWDKRYYKRMDFLIDGIYND